MSEKIAKVYESQLEAIKDSRSRDLPLFVANSGDKQLWVVAVSDHQAELGLVNYIWPLSKINKRIRDYRYTMLLEEAWQAGRTPEALENLE